MTFALALAAYALLPLTGIAVLRIDAVRRMDAEARIALAWACGALLTGAVMSTLSILRVEWTRTHLVPVLCAIIAIGALSIRGRNHREPRPESSNDRLARACTWLVAALTAYGVLTARETCGDLQYFWGPKAIQFVRAGGIDPAFLRNPDYYQMHPDYPPLLPLVYAWSNLVSRQFSWVAALALTPLLLLACAAILRSASGSALDGLLLAAILAQPIAVGFAAGAAEPLLLLYETIALVALVFVHEPRAQVILGAIGVTGAVMTKIEGTTFAIAIVIAAALILRQPKRAALIAAPATLALAAWFVFLRTTGTLDMYAAAGRYPIRFEALPKAIALLAKVGSFGTYWLPWIMALVLIALGNARRAAVPVAVAALTFVAALYFYVHVPDPTWWIEVSGHRVLLTPLLALTIGAAAAWSESAENDIG